MPHNLRTLIIGVGGTGKKVIQGMVRMIDEELDETEYPFLEFLVIDSELDWTGMTTRKGIIQTRFVGLDLAGGQGNTVPELIANNNDWAESAFWLPAFYNNPALWSIAQIGQRRPAGRTTLVNNWKRITSTLRQTSFVTNNPAIIGGVQPVPQQELILVTSLCGGTGGGTAMDTLRLTHQLLHQGIDHRIRIFLFDPSFFPAAQQDNIYANWYASLLELNYLLHPRVYSQRKDYMYRLGPQVEGDPACQHFSSGIPPLHAAANEVFLLESQVRAGGGNITISLDQMARSVARFALMRASNRGVTHHAWNMTATPLAVNLMAATNAVTVGNQRWPEGQPCLYSSVNQATLWYPIKRLLHCLSREAIHKFSENLLKYPSGSMEEVPAKATILTQAVQESGLGRIQTTLNQFSGSGDCLALRELFQKIRDCQVVIPAELLSPQGTANNISLLEHLESESWSTLLRSHLNNVGAGIDSAKGAQDVISAVNMRRDAIRRSIDASINKIPTSGELMQLLWKYVYSMEGGDLWPGCMLSQGSLQDCRTFMQHFYCLSQGGLSGLVPQLIQDLQAFVTPAQTLIDTLQSTKGVTTHTGHPIANLINSTFSWVTFLPAQRTRAREEAKKLVHAWYRFRLRVKLASALMARLTDELQICLQSANSYLDALESRLTTKAPSHEFGTRDDSLQKEIPFEKIFRKIENSTAYEDLLWRWRKEVLCRETKTDPILVGLDPCVIEAGKILDSSGFDAEDWRTRTERLHQFEIEELIHRRLCGNSSTYQQYMQFILNEVDFEGMIAENRDLKATLISWSQLQPSFRVRKHVLDNLGLNNRFFLLVCLPIRTENEPCGQGQNCPLLQNPNAVCAHYAGYDWCLKKFIIENYPNIHIIQPSEETGSGDMELTIISAAYGFPLCAAESLEKTSRIPEKYIVTLRENYLNYLNPAKTMPPPHFHWPMYRVGGSSAWPDIHEDFRILELTDEEKERREKEAQAESGGQTEKVAYRNFLRKEWLPGED